MHRLTYNQSVFTNNNQAFHINKPMKTTSAVISKQIIGIKKGLCLTKKNRQCQHLNVICKL
jgi:hypothetical protein